MNENVYVPLLVNFNCTGNVCANSSDMLQPNSLTSVWDYENWIYIGYISVSFLIGIPGNTLVLIILCSSKSRNDTDWYILFISIFGITGLLSEVLLSILMKTPIRETIEFPNLCRYQMFFNYISQCAQALLFSGMSVERYRCVSGTTISQTNRPIRRGLVVSLTLTALAILLGLPTVIFKWDVVNNACTISPGQEIAKTVFFGGLTTLFLVLFIISIASYALLLTKLYMSQRRVFRVTKVGLRRRRMNIFPMKTAKVGVAVSCVSPTHRERGGEASTSMNIQMFMIPKTRNNTALTPLPAAEESALRSNKASSRNRRQGFLPVMASSSVTDISENKKRIYLEGKRKKYTGKQSSLKTSDILNKPNSSRPKDMKRPTFIIILATLIFIISWLPPITLGFCRHLFNQDHLNSRSAAYSVLFMRKSHFLNNFINPILYLTLHAEVRKRAKILLCRSR